MVSQNPNCRVDLELLTKLGHLQNRSEGKPVRNKGRSVLYATYNEHDNVAFQVSVYLSFRVQESNKRLKTDLQLLAKMF